MIRWIGSFSFVKLNSKRMRQLTITIPKNWFIEFFNDIQIFGLSKVYSNFWSVLKFYKMIYYIRLKYESCNHCLSILMRLHDLFSGELRLVGLVLVIKSRWIKNEDCIHFTLLRVNVYSNWKNRDSPESCLEK